MANTCFPLMENISLNNYWALESIITLCMHFVILWQAKKDSHILAPL